MVNAALRSAPLSSPKAAHFDADVIRRPRDLPSDFGDAFANERLQFAKGGADRVNPDLTAVGAFLSSLMELFSEHCPR